jgi:hypothetical protein
MQHIYILTGFQGIGKTSQVDELSSLLGCHRIIDDWDGYEGIGCGTLAITEGEYLMPAGAVSFYVEDVAGLDALVKLIQPAASSARPAVLGTPIGHRP